MPPLSLAENEVWVKRIAVQLFDVSIVCTGLLLISWSSTDKLLYVYVQTMERLHVDAQYAHLDITSNNIMLRSGQPAQSWDQIRLLDLGLAQPCTTGMSCLHLLWCKSIVWL